MRYYGWSISDANHYRYRTLESIQERKENSDPLTLWKEHLVELGILSLDEAEELWKASKAEAVFSAEAAKLTTPPPLSAITDHVYWESDHGTPTSKSGHRFFS